MKEYMIEAEKCLASGKEGRRRQREWKREEGRRERGRGERVYDGGSKAYGVKKRGSTRENGKEGS